MAAQAPGTWPMSPPSTPLSDKSRHLSLPSDRQSDATPEGSQGCQQCAFIPVMTNVLGSAGEACGQLAGKGMSHAQLCPMAAVSGETPKVIWNADYSTQLLFPSHCFLHINFPVLTQSHLQLSPRASQTPWSTEDLTETTKHDVMLGKGRGQRPEIMPTRSDSVKAMSSRVREGFSNHVFTALEPCRSTATH